jgi:hypothetical protein
MAVEQHLKRRLRMAPMWAFSTANAVAGYRRSHSRVVMSCTTWGTCAVQQYTKQSQGSYS